MEWKKVEETSLVPTTTFEEVARGVFPEGAEKNVLPEVAVRQRGAAPIRFFFVLNGHG